MAGNMVRCPEGHFYDSTQHNTCPWCGVQKGQGGGSDLAGKTRPVSPGPPPLPPQPLDPAAQSATRRFAPEGDQAASFDPVVGWLVCVEGGDRGRDFRLRTAKNFIGRAPGMDVCLIRDDSVSREKHAAVAFEPEEGKFWLLPGDAQGLVYLNGKVVHTPVELASEDKIKVGQTTLMLVPLCGDKFRWQ